MKFFSTNFEGDPNLGMYGFATDKYALLGIDKKLDLGVEKKIVSIAGTKFVGMFATGNSEKIVATGLVESHELAELKKIADVLVLKSDFTAVGNLLLLNDNGCIISPLISSMKEKIEEFLGVNCAVTKIAGTNIVGSCAICNNSRCAVHPGASSGEIEIIEKTLRVKVGPSTANFGSPFVGSCIIANDNVVVVSEQATGPELSMLNDVFY